MRLWNRILGLIGRLGGSPIDDFPDFVPFVPPPAAPNCPLQSDEWAAHVRLEQAKADKMAEAFPLGTEFQYLGEPMRVVGHKARVLCSGLSHLPLETCAAEMVCEYRTESGIASKSFTYDQAQHLPGAESAEWDLGPIDNQEVR